MMFTTELFCFLISRDQLICYRRRGINEMDGWLKELPGRGARDELKGVEIEN